MYIRNKIYLILSDHEPTTVRLGRERRGKGGNVEWEKGGKGGR
jgi:hypothetical protein